MIVGCRQIAVVAPAEGEFGVGGDRPGRRLVMRPSGFGQAARGLSLRVRIRRIRDEPFRLSL